MMFTFSKEIIFHINGSIIFFSRWGNLPSIPCSQSLFILEIIPSPRLKNIPSRFLSLQISHKMNIHFMSKQCFKLLLCKHHIRRDIQFRSLPHSHRHSRKRRTIFYHFYSKNSLFGKIFFTILIDFTKL